MGYKQTGYLKQLWYMIKYLFKHRKKRKENNNGKR